MTTRFKQTRVESTKEYREGYLCFERGGSRRECTYLKDSAAHAKWLAGYLDAEQDDFQDDR